MPKSVYEVLIARNETTVYTIEVEAKNEKDAEKLAYQRYGKGYWDDEDVVYGEEQTHEINYIKDLEDAYQN